MTNEEGEKYKVKAFTHGGASPIECADKLCHRKIKTGEDCFLDVLDGVMGGREQLAEGSQSNLPRCNKCQS